MSKTLRATIAYVPIMIVYLYFNSKCNWNMPFWVTLCISFATFWTFLGIFTGGD